MPLKHRLQLTSSMSVNMLRALARACADSPESCLPLPDTKPSVGVPMSPGAGDAPAVCGLGAGMALVEGGVVEEATGVREVQEDESVVVAAVCWGV